MTGKFLSSIFIVVSNVIIISAQASPEQEVLSGREEFFKIKTRSLELERVKREADKPLLKDDLDVGFPAIKEDFERIQKLNEKVFELTSAKIPIDYAAVLKSVTEINRRSARLKSNLFADVAEERKKTENNQPNNAAQSFESRLINLDKSILSFAHNPIFQNVNLVNPQDSVKAQDDLETIIKVSAAIKENAKKLVKSNSKE